MSEARLMLAICGAAFGIAMAHNGQAGPAVCGLLGAFILAAVEVLTRWRPWDDLNEVPDDGDGP